MIPINGKIIKRFLLIIIQDSVYFHFLMQKFFYSKNNLTFVPTFEIFMTVLFIFSSFIIRFSLSLQ